MEGKKAKAGASKDTTTLSLLNEQIRDLRDRHLPHTPYLLEVITDYPYRTEFPHENKNTPFQSWEVKPLQYMTFVQDGDRGIATARGNWEDEFAGPPSTSADARSNTPTPNALRETKKASVKYSIKDYKSMKETGVKPSPKPLAADAERKPGQSKNPNLSVSTPMSRVPSMEGGLAGVRQNGASSVGHVARAEKGNREDRSSDTFPARPEARERPRHSLNGHADFRDPLHSKTHTPKLSKPEQHTLPPIKHSLPPRPPSPRRDRQVSDPRKRPLDSATVPPEKRTKIEPTKSMSNALNNSSKKQESRSDTRPSPLKSQRPPAQASPLPRKPGQVSKSIDTKQASKSHSEKPNNLPPLLSPLPADLDNETTSHPSSFGSHIKESKSGRNSSANTPSTKSKAPNRDTIVVKNSANESSPLSTPPNSSSPPFILPPILSPGLPEIVEQELLRLQYKATALNTVEARHEKVRQPDTPGVARKTVKSKVGHPPKKPPAESSKAQDGERAEKAEKVSSSTPSRMVKLEYRKSSRKIIEQILKLKPKPQSEYKKPEPKPEPKRFQVAHESESEEDAPLASLKPPPPPARKRPVESVEPQPSEPPPKRREMETSKPPNTQLKPAFKSPAPSVPSDKNLLATPKRSEAVKTVAMRRVDSNDGNARTPQAAPASTPASAEKPPRINGDVRLPIQNSPDVERLMAEEKRHIEHANKLKHKMDDILKIKSKTREIVSEGQKKLGLCIAFESLTVYMQAFTFSIRSLRASNRLPTTSQWESCLRLWEFMDSYSRQFPPFQALSTRLGAVCREELRRCGLESKEYAMKEGKCLDLLKSSDLKRDMLWGRAHATRSTLQELGIAGGDVVGPWSGVGDVTGFAMEFLGAYARRERVPWRREVLGGGEKGEKEKER